MKALKSLKRFGLKLAYRPAKVVLSWQQQPEAVLCVLQCHGAVLYIRHSYGDQGLWQLPGGLVKLRLLRRRKETPFEAVKRELRQELGLTLAEILYLGSRHDNSKRVHYFKAYLDSKLLPELAPEIIDFQWCLLPPDGAGDGAKHGFRLARQATAHSRRLRAAS